MSKNQSQFTIYMATNTVNGKRYIGITRRGLAKRKKQHLFEARRGSTGCNRLYDAIRKYGEGAFRWQTIATASNEKSAFRIERALIKKVRRHSEEYNVTDGGEGGRSNAPISESARERCRQLGLENKERWALYSHLGPIASRKSVICLNTGTIYSSASAAAAENNISKSLVIEVCLRNKRRKTAKGLVFRYVGDTHGGKEEARQMLAARDSGRKVGGAKCAKPIICKTYGIQFRSAGAASLQYCIPRQSITAVCNGKKPSVYGLQFSYIEDRA
jgi:hypothetical protein